LLWEHKFGILSYGIFACRAAGCTTPAVRYYTLNPFTEMQQDISQAVFGDTLPIDVGPARFRKIPYGF